MAKPQVLGPKPKQRKEENKRMFALHEVDPDRVQALDREFMRRQCPEDDSWPNKSISHGKRTDEQMLIAALEQSLLLDEDSPSD